MSERKSSRAEQIAGQILSFVRREGLEAGARLVEQRLADALGVSRGPIRSGLKALAQAGLVTGARNCGYALAEGPDSKSVNSIIATSQDAERVYRAIANDRLDGRLPEIVSEAELMRSYDITRSELLRLLDRIASEGWIVRMPGYGWRFAETLSSPETFNQAAEFRAVIEPAALLQRGYSLEAETIERLKARQRYILGDGLDILSITDIFDLGCEFHEEIVRGSSNPFYVEALKRANSIRRLFAYRSYADRDGIRRHIRQHLRMLDLIEAGRIEEAAQLLTRHLRDPLRQGGG